MGISLLLPLLCLWGVTAPVESYLTPQKLQTIWKYIDSTYPSMESIGTAMYAVALSIPSDRCNQDISDSILEQILRKDNIAFKARGDVMYTGERLMIAKPIKHTTEPAVHAEYRLLEQLQHDTDFITDNSCIVFFVRASPCLEKCLSESIDNILKLLLIFNNWKEQEKAFLFQDIYSRDLGEKKPEDKKKLLTAFKLIEESVPLYRCNKYTTNGCIHCVTDDECFYEFSTASHENTASKSQAGVKRKTDQSSSKQPKKLKSSG